MTLKKYEQEQLAVRLLIAWRVVERDVVGKLLRQARKENRYYLSVNELLEQAIFHVLTHRERDALPEPLGEYLEAASIDEVREAVRSKFPKDEYSEEDFKVPKR